MDGKPEQDEPGAVSEPRRWELPFCDPCRGAVVVPVSAAPAERFPGDYGGEGWRPLGVTGFAVRCEGAPDGAVRVQWRPDCWPVVTERQPDEH